MDYEDYIITSDRDNINIHENYEVEYWTKELGVSREALQQAVATVGTAVEDIRKYLEQ